MILSLWLGKQSEKNHFMYVGFLLWVDHTDAAKRKTATFLILQQNIDVKNCFIFCTGASPPELPFQVGNNQNPVDRDDWREKKCKNVCVPASALTSDILHATPRPYLLEHVCFTSQWTFDWVQPSEY